MNKQTSSLPKQLADGLLLRWATAADTEAIADFNMRIHSDDPENPYQFLRYWTQDLMAEFHPTCSPANFTVVVDTHSDDQVVSSMNLISQTWSYDGIPFAVGRPELVGTDDHYRRKRLVRYQFEAVHAKSEARGEMVQAITGIPWFYRQFGYEMCVNLGGSRQLYWAKQRHLEVDEEVYSLRDVTEDDIPILDQLYGRFCTHSLLNRLRDEAEWRYELFDAHRESPYARNVKMIADLEGNIVGYVEYQQWGTHFSFREIAVAEGVSLRAVALFVCRQLQKEADTLNKEREKPIDHITFELGDSHPLYTALDRELDKQRPPYAWYIRVADVPAFLRHIAPVLEKRLAASMMAGYSGKIQLNFYRVQYELVWEKGRLQAVQPYQPKTFEDGHAFFPDLTFLQLLFGHRSLSELDRAFTDCFARNPDAAVLLDAIFPKRPSLILPLG